MTRFGLALLAASLLAPLAACDDGSAKRMWSRIEEEQARAHPPQLWSAQVLPEREDAPAITVCTDQHLREGFLTMTPAIGGEHCVREGEATKTATGSHYRCQVGRARYAVSVGVTGDVKTDFTANTAIHPLQGGSDFSQTIRYRHIGACPAGWRAGDSTNRKGERVQAR
jgi:hypothetical protein